jgi:hypothetical protein
MIYDFEHGQIDRQESAIKLGRQTGAVAATLIMFVTFLVVFMGKFI